MSFDKINVEGVILKNKPLSNFELIDAAKKLKIKNFRGVFVRDELPKRPRDAECGILNLDDSNGTGTHWTAWFKNGSRKLYFDSYGLTPPIELVEYLCHPVLHNSERIQPDGQVFCGHLCVFIFLKSVMGKISKKL